MVQVLVWVGAMRPVSVMTKQIKFNPEVTASLNSELICLNSAFCDGLADKFGEQHDLSTLDQDKGALSLNALALVEPLKRYSNVSSALAREEEALKEYFIVREGSVDIHDRLLFWKVHRVCEFEEVLLSKLDNVELKHINFLRDQFVLQTLSKIRSSLDPDLLAKVEADPTNQIGMWLPLPISKVMLDNENRGWSTLGLVETKKRRGWGLVSQHAKFDPVVQELLLFPQPQGGNTGLDGFKVNTFSSDGLVDLKNAHSLLTQCHNELGNNTCLQDKIASVCHSMQSFFGQVALQDAVLRRKGRQRFSGITMLHAFILSMTVRTSTSGPPFITALKSAVGLAVPPTDRDAAQEYVESLAKCNGIPSRSLLGKLRFRVEMTYMLTMEEEWEQYLSGEGCVIFLGLDSSPQGGRDYLMTVLRIVRKDALCDLFGCILLLENHCDQELTVQEFLAEADGMESLCKEIASYWVDHVLPPTAKGAAAGTLGHICSKLTHSFRLECGNFQRTAAAIKSVEFSLADYGTESLISKTDPAELPLHKLCPWFEEPEEKQGDNSWTNPEIEEDFCQPLTRDVVEEEDFTVGPAQCPAAPGADPTVPCFDMSATMHTVATLHCLHNAIGDIEAALPHFKAMADKIEALCNFLSSSWSKEKLMERLYDTRGPVGSEMGRQIRGFKWSVHRKRWASIAPAVRELLKIRVALLWGWNAQLLAPGFQQASALLAQLGAEGNSHLKFGVRVKTIDLIISDTICLSYLQMLLILSDGIDELVFYVESCSCHYRHYKRLGEDMPASLRRLFDSCPMRCARLADVVSGDFF